MEAHIFRDRVGGLGGEGVGNIKEFERIIKNLKVLSRASSIDKHILVAGLK
jgi:hypothetical protein